jgi:hypothetical protein
MSGFSALARPEFIGDITVTQNGELQLSADDGGLPKDRFLAGLILQFRGRFTMPGSGNPTGVTADERFGFLDRVIVKGYHKIRRADEEFFNLRGADLRELDRIYGIHAPYSAPAALTLTASAANDVEFIVWVPFVPLGMPLKQQAMWLLDAPNYQQLRLKIKTGDTDSIFTGQTTEPTLSAYGSASGSAVIRVTGLFSIGGDSKLGGFVPGRVWRHTREVTSGDIVSGNAAGSRLFELPRGNKIRNLLLCTGALSTAATAGNRVFATKSDTILTDLHVFRGLGRHIRKYTGFPVMSEEIAMSFGLAPSTGYGLIDFANHGVGGEVLETRDLIAGPTGDVDLFLQAAIAGASNQAAVLSIEEWKSGPVQIANRR